MKSGQRDIGLDITRILAFLCVVSVHFFNRTDYYYSWSDVKLQYVMMAVRGFCMTCVPLFLMLSGYLMSSKKTELTFRSYLCYMKRLVPVLLTYALATLAYVIFEGVVMNDRLYFKDYLFLLLGYFNYSWYIEMYIGLFLLIPLLNILWNYSEQKQSRQIITVVFLLLACVPTVFNYMDLLTPGAMLHPKSMQHFTKVLPFWWQDIFPVALYFVGAYMRSYIDIKALKTGRLMLMTFAAWILFTLCSVNYGRFGLSIAFTDFYGYQTVILAVLIFLIINSIHYPPIPAPAVKVIGFISKITLGAYLVSYCPDEYLYMVLRSEKYLTIDRFHSFVPTVAKSVIISLALAAVLYFVQKLIETAFSTALRAIKDGVKE